ncbi:MAG: YabP/YqfC family sporulation protein [Firmicutes bacterium]|nr:YabP/YqfC family sporulation protein [Bacillota bacterium]
MINDAKSGAQTINPHNVEVYDRSRMVISGVNDVSEFSDDIIKLKTTLGEMQVKGSKLSISKLDTAAGEVELNGAIDLIQYSARKKGGFLAGLLK